MLQLGGKIKGNLTDQTDLKNVLDNKQAQLISGENIKTINNQSILGNGNIDIQGGISTLKTINNETLEGEGNIDLQVPLVSGTNIKTINNNSILGSGNIDISLDEIYSTTETKVGIWINGKPLYRKVYSVPSINANTSWSSALPSNASVVKLSGIVYQAGYAQPLSLVSLDALSYQAILYATSSIIAIQTGRDRIIDSGYVVVEYTKTTD